MRPLDPRLPREVPAARRHLALCAALAAVTAAAVVAQAALIGRVVAGAFLEGETPAQVARPLVWLAVASVVRGVAAWAFDAAGSLAAAATLSTLRTRLLAALVRARPGGLGVLRAGDVAGAALDGADALEPYFARFLPQLALGAVVPPVILAWTFLHDLASGLVLLATLPLIPAFGILIGRATERATMRRFRALSLLSTHFVDVVRGLPTLRAYRRSGAQAEAIARYTDDYRRTTMATLRIAFLSAFALELAAMLGTAVVAVELGVRLTDGGIALAPSLAILVLAPELYAPLRGAAAQFHASADGLAAAGRLFELIDLEGPPGASGQAPADGELRLRDVVVVRAGRGRVLDGLDLTLEPGEHVAVLGPSGSGKSTLLSLLLRFVEPAAGAVELAGVDARTVDPGSWRARFAWVPQRPLLEPGTVAETVGLGRADDGEVRSALVAAGAASLAGRLDASLEDLSAGERRRAAIARALLRDAPIVLLDEPTAHLDPAAAEAVVETIASLPRSRSVLVVTHDERLAAAADRVLELRDGCLVSRSAEVAA